MLDFLSCLDFAIHRSVYTNVILKPKQVTCLESLFLGKDVLGILPTGFGKSLIFHLLPYLLSRKREIQTRNLNENQQQQTSCVIVISPLNSLIHDQIARLRLAGVRVRILKTDMDYLDDESESHDEVCDILFAHPESIISCKFGRDVLQSDSYQDSVAAIVIDEAQCILEW